MTEEKVDGRVRLGISSVWQRSPGFVPTGVLEHIAQFPGKHAANRGCSGNMWPSESNVAIFFWQCSRITWRNDISGDDVNIYLSYNFALKCCWIQFTKRATNVRIPLQQMEKLGMKEETNCLSTPKSLVITPGFRLFKTSKMRPLPPAHIMPFKNSRWQNL